MDNIDLYYQSLKQVLDDLEAWQPPKPSAVKRIFDWLFGLIVALFILSLVPIIPAALLFLRSVIPIRIGTFLDTSSGSFASFALLWLGASIASGILLVISNLIRNRIEDGSGKPTRPPQTLSPDQIAFVRTYQAYKELKIYFVSHIERHVENAHAALAKELTPVSLHLRGRPADSQFANSDRQLDDDPLSSAAFVAAMASPYNLSLSTRSRGSLSSQLTAARRLLGTFDKYDWFRLNSESESVLKALIALRSRVLPRLREKEELPRVLEILEHLSKFLYSFLPEHATDRSSEELEELHVLGREEMVKFIDLVDDLPEFQQEEKSQKKNIPAKSNFKQMINGVYRRYIFARFVVWFVILLLLTFAGVQLFNQFVPISPDAMATIVIGSSVAGSTGIAVFLPRRSSSE